MNILNVLIIEDDARNAAVYQQMLEHRLAGSRVMVMVAATGLEGLNAAGSSRFDLILIDFNLPDLPGYHVGLALATRMRRGHLPTVPLVALTAQTGDANVELARRCGFAAFVAKPCSEADLLTIVEQFADRFTDRREAHSNAL